VGLIGAAIGCFSDVLPRIAGGEADISGAGDLRLGGHQGDAPRQGDHPKGLPRAEAELLADPLGNHNLELRGNGRDIHGKVVIRDADRS
jgi:hypothetical protein